MSLARQQYVYIYIYSSITLIDILKYVGLSMYIHAKPQYIHIGHTLNMYVQQYS